MSPVNEPQLFKGGGSHASTSRLRESNQALAELKTKLEFALSRLNDQDTQRTGIEEIREFLQTLYPDWFPMVISCIGEAGTNLKPLGRCESVKLLGLLAELHGDAVVPLLPRILQVVVTRLQDADLHLREACAETVFRLTRALVIDDEGAAVFATLLKPLFGALGEHSKWVQIGAAACICSVIQGSPPSVVSDNLGRLFSRLTQHLSLPLAMAKPQLLGACIYAMEAVTDADFDEVLPALMSSLEGCLNASSDWQTRKQAIEVLQTIGDNPDLGQSLELSPSSNVPGPTPLQRRIALLLQVVRNDKVRAVREAVKDVMLHWAITKVPGPTGMVRSSSPTNSEAPRPGSAAPRSSSPIHGSWLDRELVKSQAEGGGPPMQQSASSSTVGNAGVRQNRSVRASTREREEEVKVLAPPVRPRASAELTPGVAERTDAASEKARAIKAALSGAALNSTKKPRPKRERQSIFSGPTNKSFFTMAEQPAAGGAGVGDGGEDMEPGGEEGAEAYEDAMLRAHEIQSLQQRDSPRRERWPDNAVPETPAWARDDAGFGPLRSQDLNGGEENGRDVDLHIGGYPDLSEDEADNLEQESPPVPPVTSVTSLPAETASVTSFRAVLAAETVPPLTSPPAETAPAVAVAASVRRMPSGSSPRLRSDRGGSARRLPSGSAPVRHPSPRVTPRQPLPPGDDAGRLVSSSVLEELTQRLRLLEEEKQEEQENLINMLNVLEQTCEGQSEILEAQRLQLDETELRLQAQEQQYRQHEQRAQQQEQQVRQQEARLHEQELQIQQLEQQTEEHQQVLREHEQQMEQQEQLLEETATELLAQKTLVAELQELQATSSASQAAFASSSRPGAQPEDQATRQPVPLLATPVDTAGSLPPSREIERPVTAASAAVTVASLRETLLQGPGPLDTGASVGQAGARGVQGKKMSGPLWDKVLELCEQQRFLEAYKQVIAEPEEICLLRLMQHTGPIVEQLDAESNSRLIRRLIHILSSPKEPASACIEQVFSWLWQALEVGIHFTSSQVEDLAAALQKASSPHSFRERTEATELLSRVSALRRS